MSPQKFLEVVQAIPGLGKQRIRLAGIMASGSFSAKMTDVLCICPAWITYGRR